MNLMINSEKDNMDKFMKAVKDLVLKRKLMHEKALKAACGKMDYLNYGPKTRKQKSDYYLMRKRARSRKVIKGIVNGKKSTKV